MESEIEIKLPKLGESIVSATVVKWFKKEGDLVKLDEPLLEVSTDKVNSEIPSPVSGKLKKILASPDEELEVGAPLAIISTSESDTLAPSPAAAVHGASYLTASSSKKGFFTPVVLKIAQEKGIGLDELENISATGAGGRLSKRDLERYLEEKKPFSSLKESKEGDYERIPMGGMRKAIAENMVRASKEIPSATLVNEVDVTPVMKVIAEEKENFYAKYGCKLSITSFIAQAIAKGAREFPFVNASLEDGSIIVKHFVNLGIAVSVDQGILVPVIQGCDCLSLHEIAKEVSELSLKARTKKLDPSQVKAGTITMTNFGMSGTLIGVPIIRYPEAAIVGVGAIQKKVVVLDDDKMAIRSMMHLTLTFDHRIIDGMYGCSFLAAVKSHLEKPLQLRAR